MRKMTLLFLLLIPATAGAQSVIAIAPHQCVWHTGDNVAWAAPALDESGWQPYTQWQPNPDQSRLWVLPR